MNLPEKKTKQQDKSISVIGILNRKVLLWLAFLSFQTKGMEADLFYI
jgi:hypothetical protein